MEYASEHLLLSLAHCPMARRQRVIRRIIGVYPPDETGWGTNTVLRVADRRRIGRQWQNGSWRRGMFGPLFTLAVFFGLSGCARRAPVAPPVATTPPSAPDVQAFCSPHEVGPRLPFRVVDLGSLPQSRRVMRARHLTATFAGGINQAGDVTGSAFSCVDPGCRGYRITGDMEADRLVNRQEGFVWRNDRMSFLPDPSGPGHRKDTVFVQPICINNRGEVAGVWWVKGNNITRGVVWRKGHIDSIPSPPKQACWPVRINDAGSVVGSMGAPMGDDHAFVWQAGQIHELPGLPGNHHCFALGINKVGDVVGYSVDPGWLMRALIWHHGVPGILPLPPDVAESRAADINDRGQILLETRPPFRDTGSIKRCWIATDGKFRMLPSGRDSPLAAAMNNVDDCIGFASVPGGDGANTAVFWKKGTMYRLIECLKLRPYWRLTWGHGGFTLAPALEHGGFGLNDRGEIVITDADEVQTRCLILIPVAEHR